MSADYWEENGQIFVTGGKRYGLTETCRTICLGEVVEPEIPAPTCNKLVGGIKLPVTPVTSEQDERIRALAGQGKPVRAIARELGFRNHMIVWRALQKELIGVG